jgi:hypothetical protein
MCGPQFCSMKITQDVRDYAARAGPWPTVVQDRTDVFSMPRSGVQFFYNYRRNAYVGVPVWYDETQVSRYREGTLTVDLVDARRNRMVWTGDAIARVVKRTPEQKMAEIDQAINAIFLQYPHRAGTP